jgi:tRNA threonylcarbamoyladenosine biosynthesis protein TsaB
MRILALDAALGPCSAALVADGVMLAQHRSDDPRGASAALPGLVQAVLAAAGPAFDAVAVTVGPGSFTGIRAALALAHGLAIGAGVPVMGVTSAAALAAAWPTVPGATLWIAIDTRRGRVFLGRDGAIEAVPLDALPTPPADLMLAGDAAGAVACRIGGQVTGIDHIEARYVALAALSPANRMAAQPLYVEPPEARPAALLRPAPA